jgi:type IV pilus assembly protein PilN
MDDEIKNTPDDLVNDNLTDKESDSKPKESEDLSQSKGESNTEHRVIHKKDDKLHIYVRQDKYKGELKSKNWVGRTYINGKQKVSSSGTTNLDEAIPILEKWFDNLQAQAEDKAIDAKKNEEVLNINPSKTSDDEVNENIITSDKPTDKELKSSMFEKLKNIKFGKSKSDGNSTPESKNKSPSKKKLGSFFKNIFQSKVSKLSVAGEEIAGLDITKDAIRVCQVSQDKDENWILDKFSYRLLDQEKITENVLENKDYIAEEINLAMANAKITSKNIAMSIPVTSAIIRVVTSPLMTDEELQKAIETDSLWENLVQLTDNLNDYSIFHQIINRNSKNNTMEILFVASKLSDVNSYSGIVKKAGLNPVIVDVKCFTLKNAYDNSKFKTITDKGNSAILEISGDENYLMIIHNNTPVITDVFLRQPEKELMSQIIEGPTNTEAEAVVRRYAMQIKQALSDYESKHENKITNIQVVSSLKNISNLLPVFKKNLPTVGFSLFDPLEGVAIPSYNAEKTNIENKSTIAPVIGLAYRKLDVFGYYKFVTAVKNINLLPNRDAIRQQGRLKFLSGFAFKGLAISIAAIYLLLIGFSFFQINSNKKILADFDQVQMEFDKYNLEFSKLIKKKREMDKSLELGKLVNSNQTASYRALAQITRSVPIRVNFTKMTFDGVNNVIIEGMAFSDQDILNFISNLNAKSLIEQASLAAMKVESESSQSNNKKGFIINCKLKI